jgi:xylulokinase
MIYAIAYDLGTSAVKTCLFKIDESIEMIASASSENHLYILDNGGAEQDAEEWWQGMRKTTKEVLPATGRARDFHPLDCAHAGRTQKKAATL